MSAGSIGRSSRISISHQHHSIWSRSSHWPRIAPTPAS